ncbi:proline-rich basic protein 1, partial [Echinops telfairi]|uniref:Proline-rich basic protein 1 n=1 Tax=Echinops telfairi TaxID=9371 RepID=A0ABM0ICP6_ECHTE
VEVALEERAAPARSRTVPKRQIELRPRPRSPRRASGAQRPARLLRTGSLDESLSRLQAAAGHVQTALARKLSPAPLALSRVPSGPTERLEPTTRETARGARVVQEEPRSRPPRAQDRAALPRAPRPWPSLRERAIRRDKPPPGTEPLGPVSSSIFLQSEEKVPEAPHREPKIQSQRETSNPARSPPFQTRSPWPVKPGSPSPPWEAPNGALRGPRCPPPQALSPWERAVRRVRSPSVHEASSTWENWNPAVEETVSSRRSPSPPTLAQWDLGVARARSPALEAPALRELPLPAVWVAGKGSPSPPAMPGCAAPDGPVERPGSPSSPEPRAASVQRSRAALNGVTQEAQAPSTPSTLGTPEPTEAQSPSTPEILDLAFRGGSQPSLELVAACQPPSCGHVRAPEAGERPETLRPGEAAAGHSCVAIRRPRDVRKMVKTTYAPTFPERTPILDLPVSPADPQLEKDTKPKVQDPEAPGSPEPAHYTSVFRKDFLPIVPHPYEPSGPPSNLDTAPREASKPNGIPRRRAENNTAKPFARTEIRLPRALGLLRRVEGSLGVPGRGLGGLEHPDVGGGGCLLPDGTGQVSPPEGPRTSPQGSSPEPARTHQPGPPGPNDPQAYRGLSPESSPKLETAPALTLPRETQAKARGTAPAQPRSASAPPMDRSPEGPSLGARRPLGTAHPGKVLVDPESGRYYYVEAPRQPRLRLLFDPESGQYVEVLLPPSPSGQPHHVYTPLALGSSLYPAAYAPAGLSLPSSPGLPAVSPQLPWASEARPPDRMYCLPVGGTPSPAPPLFLCAAPASSGPAQQGRASLFPV